MEQKSIFIDIETFKLIEHYRNSFEEDYNEIIKRVFQSIENYDKIEVRQFSIVNEQKSMMNHGLFWKGCLLNNGLQLRSYYKGLLHNAEVVNGKIVYNENEYTSPSAAAVEAAEGVAINGWKFWEFLDEKNNTWQNLDSLRKKTDK
jgi:hypothetical protein